MNFYDIQFNQKNRLHHFITIEDIPKKTLIEILDNAESFITFGQREIRKAPILRGKTVVNLFFEPSTRTRTTFEIAAKRLSADVINLDATRMSTTKGESLLDTVRTIEAMKTDLFVIRDSASGAALLVAKHIGDNVRIVNAGDGRHAHPTQAMLDMFTIRQQKGKFEGLKVAIVGDILHSRVARSQIHALRTLGTKDIRVIGPKTLIPTAIEKLGAKPYYRLEQGIKDVDVIIMLRLQLERMQGQLIASEQEYFQLYGLTKEKLNYANKDVIVMHPGPINRGLEIASNVADGENSVILPQVTNGIAIRMSVLAMVMSSDVR